MTRLKVDWADFMRQRHEHLRVTNALNQLDRKWHLDHSAEDGSEFTIEGVYSPTWPREVPACRFLLRIWAAPA